MSDGHPPDLPPAELLERQSAQLAGMRSRVLRRIEIARRGPVLDLGAGHGAVTGELRRRSRGPVVALDRRRAPLARVARPCVVADARALPFADGAFDLVFAQLVFLWIPDLERALDEVVRVLRPGGVLVAVEPDYGGAIEHPPSTAAAPLWEQGLRAAGADPRIGRRLACALGARGLALTVDLWPSLPPPDDDPRLLAGLVGEEAARAVTAARRAVPAAQRIALLPFFFLTARRPAGLP